MSKTGKTSKVNLVERPEWSEYDMAGELGDIISNNMAEDMSHMGAEEVENFADKILDKSPKRSSPRSVFTEAQKEALFLAFKRDDQLINEFNLMVQDAFTWAWEKAYTPTDRDIEDAIETAIEYLSKWSSDYLSSDYDRIWEVVEYNNETTHDFLRRLLDKYIHYERKENHYDRYLVFDEDVGDIMVAPRGGVLDWTPVPEIPQKEIDAELETLLQELKEAFIIAMFDDLKKDMSNKDYSNLVDVWRMWKKMLEEDPSRVRAAIKELQAFLKGVKETEDA